MLRVCLPGCTEFDYTLPSLHSDELEHIRSLERRLRTAEYDLQRCVPIFWDTECTGLRHERWWTTEASRIVQIAAITGAHEFKVDMNPYPDPMSFGAAERTHLTTEMVWGNAVPFQVWPSSWRRCTSLCLLVLSIKWLASLLATSPSAAHLSRYGAVILSLTWALQYAIREEQQARGQVASSHWWATVRRCMGSCH